MLFKIQNGGHGGHFEFSFFDYNLKTICRNVMKITALHTSTRHTYYVKIYI